VFKNIEKSEYLINYFKLFTISLLNHFNLQFLLVLKEIKQEPRLPLIPINLNMFRFPLIHLFVSKTLTSKNKNYGGKNKASFILLYK